MLTEGHVIGAVDTDASGVHAQVDDARVAVHEAIEVSLRNAVEVLACQPVVHPWLSAP